MVIPSTGLTHYALTPGTEAKAKYWGPSQSEKLHLWSDEPGSGSYVVGSRSTAISEATIHLNGEKMLISLADVAALSFFLLDRDESVETRSHEAVCFSSKRH